MSIEGPPTVKPPTGPIIKPTFDYGGGSYRQNTSIYDTISSMSGSTKTGIKWLAIGSFLLIGVLAAWRFFTRQSPSSDDNLRSSSSFSVDPQLEGLSIPKTPFVLEERSCILVAEENTYTIYDPHKARDHQTLLESYERLNLLFNHRGAKLIFTTMLKNFLNSLGSSESFKQLIEQKDENAIRALTKFLHTYYSEQVAKHGTDKEVAEKIITVLK